MEKLINELYEKRKDVVLPELIEYTKKQAGISELFSKYIIANLADPDLNMDVETLRDFVEHSVYLYENQLWNDEVPLDIFLNYVLSPRCSKEKVEACRAFFYDEVKEMLSPSKLETVLEINYWCAAHVRYQLTDPRTKSAYFSYISGSGRCGEKATFLVQVYRSIGIPARSVYVPMWTHIDDNHAWVEVYIDGAWKYIGAGEGEEMLEKAWFSLATTRASYLLSNSITWIKNDEKYLEDKNLWKTVDHTHHYTDTKLVSIKSDVKGLNKLFLSIVNYGSFRNLTQLDIEYDKVCNVSFGRGDFVLRGWVNGKPLLRLVKEEETEIILTEGDFIGSEFKFSQSPGDAALPVDYQETEEMNLRKEAKRSQRQKEYIEKMNLIKEEGMHHAAHSLLKRELAEEYDDIIKYLKPKDLEDIDPNLLIKHINVVSKYKNDVPQDIYYEYLCNPRVHWEELTYYTKKFSQYFAKFPSFKSNPKEILEWVDRNIENRDTYAIKNTYMPIDRMLDYPYGSEIDKKILTVSIAKSIGVAARYNSFKDDIEFYNGEEFITFSEELSQYQLRIKGIDETVSVSVNPVPEPSSFTVNIVEANEDQVFEDSFNEGNYEIIVSRRLPSGTQHIIVYPITLDKDLEISISIPEVNYEDVVDKTYIKDLLLEQDIHVDEGIIIVGDAIEEPTAHALNELMDRADDINRLKIPVYYVDKNPESKAKIMENTRNKINEFIVLENSNKSKEDALARRVFREPGNYPLTILFTAGESKMSYSGYHVGSIDNEWLLDIFTKEDN